MSNEQTEHIPDESVVLEAISNLSDQVISKKINDTQDRSILKLFSKGL